MKQTLAIALALAFAFALPTIVLASPLRCTDPCLVDTSYAGYRPPVVEIASGGSVVWVSNGGGGHIQADFGASGGICFVTDVGNGSPSQPATFDIVDAALVATTTELGTLACENAQAPPDGSFALPYYCTLHPQMRGAIIVVSG